MADIDWNDFSDLMTDLPKPVGAKRNHVEMKDDEELDFGDNKRHQAAKLNKQHAETESLPVAIPRAVTVPPPPPPPPTPEPVVQPKTAHPMDKGKVHVLSRFTPFLRIKSSRFPASI